MVVKVLIISTVLSGCSSFGSIFPGPEKDPLLDNYDISINYHSLEEIKEICNNPNAEGCFEPFTDPCEVHVRKNDWCSLIHEIQHCLHGFWHRDTPTDNGDCK